MLRSYRSPDWGLFPRSKSESLYLEMRDGVRLAVDLMFPSPFPKDRKLPALLHQTRYWRMPELRWPFSMLSNGLLGHTGAYVKELVKNGYVWVNVDCRGSGASFGSRDYPWSPDEVEDGREIVDWILKQSWSNGKVGGLGISYTGTTAEFLLANQHPAVKASMPLFSLYDVYDDIAFPGGIPHDGFVIDWGKANGDLDENRLPVENPLVKIFVRGVRPVGGKQGRRTLEVALREHKKNRQVSETSQGVEFRDQRPPAGIVESINEFSPHYYRQKVSDSGAALYSVSGWMDGAYPHSAIKRYLNAENPVNKLALGPWDHGAKYHITPGKVKKIGPDIVAEAVKFFDLYLKDLPTEVEKDAPVHYYTMQEEKWKAADQWPPKGFSMASFYLQPDRRLGALPPGSDSPADRIHHNPNTGTGVYTRWKGLRGQMTTGNLYPDRKKKDRLLSVYETPPLHRDTEVTGHPIVDLYVRTQETDGSFFVYLEDVTPGGAVRYVSEGLFRALHRKISDWEAYKDAVPNHSFLQEHAEPLKPGEIAHLQFDILPTSYLFRKGHRIRIAIATADKDNFRQICPEGSVYDIIRGGNFASRVQLPIRQH